MKRYKFIFLLCFVFTQHQFFAQGEANIWYFGINAGLDFNTSPPTPLTNGALSTSEGCQRVAEPNLSPLLYKTEKNRPAGCGGVPGWCWQR